MSTLSTTAQERVASAALTQSIMGEGEGSLSAREVLGMLRRRAVLITVLSIFFGTIATGGFFAWRTYYPGYRSEALIECISNIPHAELTPEQERLRQDEHERFVLTQARLLKSPAVLGEVLKLTAVRETDWWKSIENRTWKNPDQHLIELIDQLSASPVRGTNFLRVSMECRRKEDPRVVINAVVNQWYDTVKRRAAEEFVDTALDAAQRELEQFDREVSEDRSQLKTMAQRLPAGARQNPVASIVHQEAIQQTATSAVLGLELAQLDQYRAVYNDPGGLAATAEDRALVEQDPQVAELARALFLLEQQRAADAKVYGSEHSVLKQLDAQIDSVDLKLAQLRLQKLQERRADIREQVNSAYESTRHALFLSQEKLAKAEAALQDQDRLLFDYTTLETELEQKAEYRLQLTSYIKNLTRVKTQRTAINVNIAQAAIDPLERSSPSGVILALGLFAALALSFGIALGLEMADTSVRTAQDVARYMNVAVLGVIPDTDDEEVAIEKVETALGDAPSSMVAEGFRRIRTSLQFSSPPDRQRSLVVTSPLPDDGKTTVACNLAIASARGGRRVLLVDANFRRPGIHKVFENVPAQGLSNLLNGDATMASCVVETSTARLDVLGSGAIPPNPAELFGGESFGAFIKEATDRYDQVILDTAPVLLAGDALVVAPALDGTLVVVRANTSSRGGARRTCTLLGEVGAHVVGAVLNAAQVRRGGYFREQLRTYYEYQAEATKASTSTPKKP